MPGPADAGEAAHRHPAGARLVTSPASCLMVGVAPVFEAAHLFAVPEFQGPTCYGLAHHGMLADLGVAEIDAPQLRVGETIRMPGRYADHRTQPPLPIEDVLLIGSRDRDSFGRDEVVALQEVLTELASAAGRYQVTGAPPTRSWLRQVNPALVERWLADLRPMLVSAGWMVFEPRGPLLLPRGRAFEAPTREVAAEPQPSAGSPPAVPSGFTTAFPPELLAQAEARRYRLHHQGATARVCVVEDWTILEKGSLVRRRDRSGIQLCLARKRNQLIGQGLLRRTRRKGLLRLTQDIALPSLTNAARVVTGDNVPRTLWVPA
ncbi:hypothetical protein ACFQY9_17490 [Microvirga aerilata]|uniref:hypothetical protein n=1 Tax=Microvirga aerilata TaxID=670292 RepID=UPI00363D7FFC